MKSLLLAGVLLLSNKLVFAEGLIKSCNAVMYDAQKLSPFYTGLICGLSIGCVIGFCIAGLLNLSRDGWED